MRSINRERLQTLRGATLIADMRSPEYFRGGSLPEAKNLPLRNLLNELHRTDKKSNIVIVGNSVDESDMQMACTYAEQLGFTKIYKSEITKLL
jgi:rhodanese-related sulfurtransferase